MRSTPHSLKLFQAVLHGFERFGAKIRGCDFLIHYAYLLEHAGLATAKRFRQAIEQAYAKLAANPGLGAPHKLRQAKYAKIRRWPVRGFRSYLIAYRPYRGGIAVESNWSMRNRTFSAY